MVFRERHGASRRSFSPTPAASAVPLSWTSNTEAESRTTPASRLCYGVFGASFDIRTPAATETFSDWIGPSGVRQQSSSQCS